ncbi:MAG: alpha-hydroxy-acid oxidizing protein [Actinobacteria bacterium]|nr:alpha-hydroxy-acid oxidizing protein [Actinomycetota bacterium]
MRSRELEEQAREALPPEVFAYFAAGSGEQRTLAGQEAAWDGLLLRPRVLRDVSTVSTSVTVLGTPLATPVLVAPAALHGLAHPDGEVATAAGAAAAGSLIVLSMRASRPLEQIAAAAGPWWQQMYVLGDRGISDEVARRAAAAGASALVVTVDVPFVARKPTGPLPPLPREAIVEALEGRDPDDPRLKQAPDLGAADIARLKDLTGLPVVAKGVLRGDEALRCLDAGADAVIVSTHGGRQLDGVVPSALALPEVVDAVGDRAEVYVDGGVRTGTHVLRALALGATAVLTARPLLWALAVGGSDGVRDHLLELTSDTRDALGLAGCTSPADAGRDLVAL